MAINLRGWYDTREHIQDILKADDFLTKLVFRYLNIPLFAGIDTPTTIAAITIFCTARYPAHNKPNRSKEYIDSLVVGEMMAPVIPDDHSLREAPARTEFSSVVKNLMTHPMAYNRNKGYTEWVAAVTVANQDLGADDQQEIVPQDDMDYINYAEYLVWLAINLPNSMYMSPVLLVVASYVGIAKRGTMSDAYINKIQTGIRDDLGVEITLDMDMVKSTYINFGKYVTANNASEVFNRWLQDIPEHALRLRLSLEQVAGSGLTAYVVIGRCMRKYQDFPWDRLNVITGGEVEKYLAATRTVNGNLYFGFSRNLGAAKSTLYSTVAYTAKELLIQIAGETSLTRYQGWLKRPKNPAAVLKLIEDYVNASRVQQEEAAVNALDASILTGYMNIVNNAIHNNMFAQ